MLQANLAAKAQANLAVKAQANLAEIDSLDPAQLL